MWTCRPLGCSGVSSSGALGPVFASSALGRDRGHGTPSQGALRGSLWGQGCSSGMGTARDGTGQVGTGLGGSSASSSVPERSRSGWARQHPLREGCEENSLTLVSYLCLSFLGKHEGRSGSGDGLLTEALKVSARLDRQLKLS